MARLLYFAGLVDAIGRDAEDIALPAQVTRVQELLDWLRARGPEFERALVPGRLRVTVNRQVASPAAPVSDADEIAFIGTAR